MRRSSMPPRSAPLASVTPLHRTSGLPRTPMARRTAPRTAEEARARRLVRARSRGCCEGCSRAPSTDYAHRIGRGQMGRWCPSNALDLCRHCHDRAHASPAWAREMGWILRSGSHPATAPVRLAAHGWVLLAPDGSLTAVHAGGDAA